MKTKKFNLNELKIKSFVTDLDNIKGRTVQGGAAANPGSDDDTSQDLYVTHRWVCRSDYNCYTLKTRDTYTRA